MSMGRPRRWHFRQSPVPSMPHHDRMAMSWRIARWYEVSVLDFQRAGLRSGAVHCAHAIATDQDYGGVATRWREPALTEQRLTPHNCFAARGHRGGSNLL